MNLDALPISFVKLHHRRAHDQSAPIVVRCVVKSHFLP